MDLLAFKKVNIVHSIFRPNEIVELIIYWSTGAEAQSTFFGFLFSK